MTGPGKAATTLWYSSRVLYSRLTVRYPNEVTTSVYENFPRRNYIDELVIDKLRKLNIAPTNLADAATFIRRSWLDPAGVLPSAEQVAHTIAVQHSDRQQTL